MTQQALEVKGAGAPALTVLNTEAQLEYAQFLLDSKMLPHTLKTPAQVVAVLQQGHELGLAPMASIANIAIVQGRPTLGIHLIASRIRQHGVQYQLIEDFVYVREDGTADKVKQLKTRTVKGENGEEQQITEPAYKYVDMRTTIRFSYIGLQNKLVEQDMTFLWSEARKQELVGKPNWIKMPIIMMRTRCLAIGARFVAPDALMGMMETTEAAEAAGMTIQTNEDGGFAVADIIE